MVPVKNFLHKPTFNRIMCLELEGDEKESNKPIVPQKDIIKNNNSTKELTDLHSDIEKLFAAEAISGEQQDSIMNLPEFDFFTSVSDKEIAFYIFQIIAAGEGVGLSNLSGTSASYDEKLWKENNNQYWMWSLAKSINIKIADESDMKKAEFDGEYSIEALGYYDSKEFKIILCPTKIDRISTNCAIKKELLYAVVMIHELAHAIMDPTNTLKELGTKKDKPQDIHREMDRAMEESFANMITLQYFDNAKQIIDEESLNQVKDFMKKQPEPYKFGITLYERFKTDWREWRNNKSAFAIMEKWV